MQLSQSMKSEGRRHRPAHAVALGLGWFSIGLGLVQCLMPQMMARAVGLPGKEDLVRGFGYREIANGVGILMSEDPEPWIWGRVAGDAVDLGALSGGLHRHDPNRRSSALAMLAVAPVTVIDVACARALARERHRLERALPPIDFSDRSGFRRAPDQMRGAALADFEMPADYRTPEALRPWQGKVLPASESA